MAKSLAICQPGCGHKKATAAPHMAYTPETPSLSLSVPPDKSPLKKETRSAVDNPLAKGHKIKLT